MSFKVAKSRVLNSFFMDEICKFYKPSKSYKIFKEDSIFHIVTTPPPIKLKTKQNKKQTNKQTKNKQTKEIGKAHRLEL